MPERGDGTEPADRQPADHEIALGAWLSLGSPAVAELLGHAGFDWVLIDQQHAAVGPSEMLELVRAVASSGAAPIVRIAANTPEYFAHALDAGAHGIMVPMVEDREAAEAAVRAFTYPPNGTRSIGGYRAHLAFGMARGEYLDSPPASLIVQIEHRRAIDNVEEIASVPGIDVLFVGPQDLSASYGLRPSLEIGHPRMREAIDALVRAARVHGVGLGSLCSGVDSAREYVDAGFSMLAIGTDAAMLTGAATTTLGALTDPGRPRRTALTRRGR